MMNIFRDRISTFECAVDFDISFHLQIYMSMEKLLFTERMLIAIYSSLVSEMDIRYINHFIYTDVALIDRYMSTSALAFPLPLKLAFSITIKFH